MLTRAKAFSLTMAALLVLTLVPGAPITAAPPRTRISGIQTDSFDSRSNDPLNPAHPLFSTADAENVELVGHIGGVTHAVAVQGNYAYVGEGPRLTILNVSNPASPIVVGKTPPLPGLVQAVAVAEGYAYVADDYAGLRVVDVSDLTNRMEVGYNMRWGCAWDVSVVGDYAYLADGGVGLRVIDVSIPSNPTEVGAYNTPEYARGVAVAEGYAYVADGDGGLRVVDVSIPSNPTEVGFYDTPGHAWNVVVVGGYAYVADGRGELRVVDVSTPANPTEVGSCDTLWYVEAIAIVGDYAYIADHDGVKVVDISTPSDPIEVGAGHTPGQAEDIAVAGAYAYVADENAGLRVVDVSNPTEPTEVGFHDTLGEAYEVVISGNYAYVADGGGGLRVVNVSDPANPTEVGFYDQVVSAEDVAVAEGFAYVTDSDLRVIDISTPANPTEVGFYDTKWSQGVTIVGGYAYVVDYWDGLIVVDVSTPSNPTEMGACKTPDGARSVTVAGSYVYIANGEQGLRVVDVSNLAAPVEVGFYDTPGEAVDVAVAGSYAYVADENEGLRVVDVSNPASPTEVGFYDDPTGPVYGVAIAGEYAYVANGFQGGLRVLDISTPSNPTEVGSYDTANYAFGVAVAGGYGYVASNWGGLFVLHYTGGGDTTPPSISNIRESNDPINRKGCPEPITVTIRADVTDDSALDWVRLHYQPPSGSWTYTNMGQELGTTHRATVGNFSQAGTLRYYVKARDTAGNEGQSTTRTVTVNDCENAPNGLDVSQLERGDILLVNAGGPWLIHLVGAFGGYWGHTGMYAGDGQVVESIGEGVKQRPIDQTTFWTSRDWVVKRVNTTDLWKTYATIFAQDQIDKLYNKVFVNKWRTDKYYCSQLVWRAYYEADVDIDSNWSIASCLVSGNPAICALLVAAVPPDDIYYDDDVTEVQAKIWDAKRAVLYLGSPADLYITDPYGRHVGVDPITGSVVEEIPEVLYYSGPDAEPEHVVIMDMEGSWDVKVIGRESGSYTLVTEVVGLGEKHQVDYVTETTSPWEIDDYTLVYPTTPGDPIRVTEHSVYIPLILRRR